MLALSDFNESSTKGSSLYLTHISAHALMTSSCSGKEYFGDRYVVSACVSFMIKGRS